jgi:two-component system LytT family response regulator
MKALIVDDEPLARRELRRLLAPFSWIEIVGEASDVDEAREQIEALAPGVVFLDVQMPGGSGFDLLAKLDRVPQIIFTTAYDQYAVKAFDVSALDYLLKPIEPERLAAALQKVHAASILAAANGAPGTAGSEVGTAGSALGAASSGSGTAGAAAIGPHRHDVPLEQLFVRDGPRCWFVPLREVSVFTAEGNYVRLQWGKAHPLLGRSLIALEEKLDARKFFRANRRQIVNLDFIESVELGEGGRLHVQLRDGLEIEISRRQARLFRARTSV